MCQCPAPKTVQAGPNQVAPWFAVAPRTSGTRRSRSPHRRRSHRHPVDDQAGSDDELGRDCHRSAVHPRRCGRAPGRADDGCLLPARVSRHRVRRIERASRGIHLRLGGVEALLYRCHQRSDGCAVEGWCAGAVCDRVGAGRSARVECNDANLHASGCTDRSGPCHLAAFRHRGDSQSRTAGAPEQLSDDAARAVRRSTERASAHQAGVHLGYIGGDAAGITEDDRGDVERPVAEYVGVERIDRRIVPDQH